MSRRKRFFILLFISSLSCFLLAASTEHLIKQLKHKKHLKRIEAATKIGSSCDPIAISHLIESLNDENADVRKAVSEALVKYGNLAIEPLLFSLVDADSRMFDEIRKTLNNLRKVSLSKMQKYLKHDDPQIRIVVSSILSQETDANLTQSFVECLKDSESEVRANALKGIIKQRGNDWKAAIQNCLTDSSPEVRKIAATELGVRKDNSLLMELIVCLKDEDSTVRNATLNSLEQIGCPAIEPLIAFWAADRSPMRSQVEVLLTKKASISTMPLINYCLLHPNAPEEIYLMMDKLGKPVQDSLFTSLMSKDKGVRFGSASLLSRMKYSPDTSYKKLIYAIAKEDWTTFNQVLPLATRADLKLLVEKYEDEAVSKQIADLLSTQERELMAKTASLFDGTLVGMKSGCVQIDTLAWASLAKHRFFNGDYLGIVASVSTLGLPYTLNTNTYIKYDNGVIDSTWVVWFPDWESNQSLSATDGAAISAEISMPGIEIGCAWGRRSSSIGMGYGSVLGFTGRCYLEWNMAYTNKALFQNSQLGMLEVDSSKSPSLSRMLLLFQKQYNGVDEICIAGNVFKVK